MARKRAIYTKHPHPIIYFKFEKGRHTQFGICDLNIWNL